VKIRGYRVEPGEAQAVLATYPGIRDAVVVARVEAPGDVRLAGYFVSVGGRALTSSELAAHCAEHLPDYLVPSSFTELAAVPLNANGKLDRAALPAPDADRNEEYEGPRDIVEERIAAILDELLGTPFGIHDNFFRNGGNSILAIRLIASIQSEFDVALPVRTVFEDPTVAGMAAAVEAQIRAEIDQMPDSELLEEYTR
jgi:acyl carrier protein